MPDSGSGGRSLEALLGEIARAPDVVPASSLVGKTIGRYRIDALLGRGGMGVVYRAFDGKLARDVALKVLPAELLGDSERRARFLREARLAAAVTHPCTAAVYDVGEDGDAAFITMELIRGETLRVALEAGPFDVTRAVRITRDIARGLAKAHESGIVHRDLKPENVMLDEEDQVKVLDFGLAKLREPEREGDPSTSTEAGRIHGTPSYMSPEQAKGKKVDARSDLFSLGVVLYEMLAGERPFRGDSTLEVLIAIDRDPPPPLTRKDVPRRLVDVLDRCLEKDPTRRYPSARDLADALQSLPEVPARASRVWWLVAAAVAIGFGAVGVTSRRVPAPGAAAETSAPGAASALSVAGSVLACPQLEVKGIDPPDGWLGAAAASLACRRAAWFLGGQDARTRIPAELLELPRAPRDDFPADPFCEETARARQVEVARRTAAAWLDGDVERSAEAFQVRLKLRDGGGRELSHGEATAALLVDAVAHALDLLALPQAPLDKEIALWSGFDDPALARTFDAWATSLEYGRTEMSATLQARAAELGPTWALVRAMHATYSAKDVTAIAAPPLDRTTPARLALTAGPRSAIEADLDPTIADELHVLFEKQADGIGRVTLANLEAQIRYRRGDVAPIRDVLTGIVEKHPRVTATWSTLAVAAFGRELPVVARAYAAWVPDAPDAWNIISWSQRDAAKRMKPMKRAWLLAPDAPLFSTSYVRELIQSGERAEARSVAARLLSGPAPHKPAGLAAMVTVEAGHARFGEALARARAMFDAIEQIGALEDGTGLGLIFAVDVAALAGEQPRFSDDLVERFVLVDPPRIFRGHFAPLHVLHVCARARPELAGRCVSRLQALIDQGYFRNGVLPQSKPWLASYRALLEGDFKRAADAARPTLESNRYPLFVLEALERSGDVATVEAIDEKLMAQALYNGASSAHVRSAKRAVKRGDAKRARELAEKVVGAWAEADVQVDAVREMRALLAKLPPR